MRRPGLPQALVLLAVLLVTWGVSGVSASQTALFVGYDIGYVAVPGALLLWALRGARRGFLETVAIGWPLGHVLEIAAFSATAAGGVRGLFPLYPIVVVLPCALVLLRGHRQAMPAGDAAPALSTRLLWVITGTLVLAIAYLSLMFFPQAPLPSTHSSVAYSADFPFFIGLIADVKNHWPGTSPGLSGFPLDYQWFDFYHLAAVSQVTHLPVPVVALRLGFLPTIVVAGLQVVHVGRTLGNAVWGAVALVILLLLGPLDLTTDGSQPFFNLFSTSLWASWSFPFGMIFLLPLLALLAERLRGDVVSRGHAVASWTLIALLMAAASGAKATILPVLLVGLALHTASSLVGRRRVPWATVGALTLGTGIFAGSFFLEYGGSGHGTMLEPLASLDRTAPAKAAIAISASGKAHTLLRLIGDAIGLAGMLLPLGGILWLWVRRHRAGIADLSLFLFVLAAGLLIANTLHQAGYSELYFQDVGYVAGCLAAAAGLCLAWSDVGTTVGISRRAVAAAFVGWMGALVIVVAVSHQLTVDPQRELLLPYGFLAAGSVAFVGVTWCVLRLLRRRTSSVLSLMLVPAMAAAALTSPLAVAPVVGRLLTGQPSTVTMPDPQSVRGLTPGLYTALEWLRDNSSTNAVFAVSNHWIDPGEIDGRCYFYSAFSERRAFVEPYDAFYGLSIVDGTAAAQEFSRRQRLNDAVFDRADPGSLRVLVTQYGVRFLFIDRLHRNADPRVLLLGRVVYSDADATVVAVSQ